MNKYSIRNGDYVFSNESGSNIIRSSSEIALLFSIDKDGTAVFHKHGTPESVASYMKLATDRYRQNGFEDMANELQMIVGKLPVDHVNRLIENSSYATKFFQEITTGKILPEGISTYPDVEL